VTFPPPAPAHNSSTPTRLVIGAGIVGQALAAALVAQGDRVLLASRSGTAVAGATAVRVDASDASALTTAAHGVSTIFLASGPREYSRWATLWPPVFDAVVAAACATGADLVMLGNLYAYGEGSTMPLTEHSPLHATDSKGAVRKLGWQQALAANNRGDIRAVEVRASDYFGPGAGATSQLGPDFFYPLIDGKTARVFGRIDQPHSWAYLPDIIDTLTAAADFDGNWGHAWHVPCAEPLTRQQLAARVNLLTRMNADVAAWPIWILHAMGLLKPDVKAANELLSQFTKPFTSDASDTEHLLGVSATSWDQSLPATVIAYRRALTSTRASSR
jgi:nucleoside-diphosphate-sugar epimerase